jgi:hypothetical protein
MIENAKVLFDSLNTAAAISVLVGQQEDLYLEVKVRRTPLSDSYKDNLAEALSGFSNSEGGVLIYGLVARGGDRTTPDVITGVSPVEDASLTHSGILSLVGQLVEPPGQGISVESRPFDRDEAKGFVLLHIPRSEGLLHRSRHDREYYRRHGHSFIRMEHCEIAEFYGRRKSPLLRLWWDVRVIMVSGNSPNRQFFVGSPWALKMSDAGLRNIRL